MRKLMLVVIGIMIWLPINVRGAVTNSAYENLKVYVFKSDNCEACEAEINWLKEMQNNTYIEIEVMDKDNYQDLYNSLKDTLNIKDDNIPLTIIGSNYFVGFDNQENKIEEAIKAYSEAKDYCDIIKKIENKEDTKDCIEQNKNIYKKSMSIFVKIIILVSLIVIIGTASIIIRDKFVK